MKFKSILTAIIAMVASHASGITNCIDIVTSATPGTNGTIVIYNVTAPELCQTNALLVCTPPSGSFFPFGTNVVLCTATDACGNSNYCSFNVVVRSEAGPVAYYPMDGAVMDVVGSNQPTNTGGLTFVPGAFGSGVSLGAGGYIEIPDAPPLDNQRFTFEAWVRPDGIGPNNDDLGSIILEKGRNDGVFDYSLSWRADGKFAFNTGHYMTGVDNSSLVISAATFPPGSLHHMAGTYDGASFQLYVDGNLEGQRASSATVEYAGTLPWTIGANPTVFFPFFQRTWVGMIDEVSIWDRSLSGAEVLAHASAIPTSVTGLVYLDEDGNCAQNGPLEIGVPGLLVRLADGFGQVAMTRVDGTYAFKAQAGAYTVNLVHTATIMETCNSGQGVTYNVMVTNGAPATGLNFATKQCCDASVTCVSKISWPCPTSLPPGVNCPHGNYGHTRYLCPCEQFQYAITVCNTCTSPLLPGAIIQLQLGPNVMFCSFPDNPSACNVTPSVPWPGMPDPNNPPCNPACSPNTGQLVQWTLIPALPAGHCCTFFVNVQVANVPLGTILCATPSVSAMCNPGDVPINVSGPPWCDTVLCSHDPNDKAVTPAGCGPFGNVLPGTPLTYRVRFQNLGNAPALRVLVLDQLDPALDPTTLEILSTSHPVTDFKILPGQMIWTFDGINLPAAASDEDGSRGEVDYRIWPKSSAGEGTTVVNSAGIYFDFNLPVLTVTTTNTIRNVPEPNAGFASAVAATNLATYNFTYTGGTADGASFAWDFGTNTSPATSADQNVSGVSFSAEGPTLITLIVTRYGCLATNQMVVWVGPCEGIPTLSLSLSNNQVFVSWNNCGILQVAESITGPWQDVLAQSPYTEDISPWQRFYRTRK